MPTTLTKKPWTVMVYMAGDDSLDAEGMPSAPGYLSPIQSVHNEVGLERMFGEPGSPQILRGRIPSRSLDERPFRSFGNGLQER